MEPFVESAKNNGVTVFEMDAWMGQEPGLSVGMTSRLGGLSGGPFASLNLALHVQDSVPDVLENRRRVADAIGFPFEAWTCAEQVHGCRVARVTAADRGKGRLSRESALQDTDALVTDEEGVWLTGFFADCVPLFFFDPDRRAVGLAHAGWKGTAGAIAAATVRAMGDAFGSRPERLLAAVGPSIGPCCYEVDRSVAEACGAAAAGTVLFQEPDGLLPPGIASAGPGKYRLDLKELNRQIMIKAGIVPTRIEISRWCTGCETEKFYSHRMEKGRTGRMMGWIGLVKR